MNGKKTEEKKKEQNKRQTTKRIKKTQQKKYIYYVKRFGDERERKLVVVGWCTCKKRTLPQKITDAMFIKLI